MVRSSVAGPGVSVGSSVSVVVGSDGCAGVESAVSVSVGVAVSMVVSISV